MADFAPQSAEPPGIHSNIKQDIGDTPKSFHVGGSSPINTNGGDKQEHGHGIHGNGDSNGYRSGSHYGNKQYNGTVAEITPNDHPVFDKFTPPSGKNNLHSNYGVTIGSSSNDGSIRRNSNNDISSSHISTPYNTKKPDHGNTFMPVVPHGPDHAPQPLDHFKRGYAERAEYRVRELAQIHGTVERGNSVASSSGGDIIAPENGAHRDHSARYPNSTRNSGLDGYNNNASNARAPSPIMERGDEKPEDMKKFSIDRPGMGSDRVAQSSAGRGAGACSGGNYYGPAADSVQGHSPSQSPSSNGNSNNNSVSMNNTKSNSYNQSNSYNNSYGSHNNHGSSNNNSYNNSNNNINSNNSKYSNHHNNYDNSYDKPPRNSGYSNYHPKPSYNSHHSRNNHNSSGFSMEDVVDRLCHPRTNVAEEMDRARHSSPESFSSGRAITAILSQLGRRRQMNVAMQVWRWMETTHGITRNVFHYNALINVCEKIKDWKRALDLLRQMDDEGVPKNEITYSSAISACEKGGNWRTALDLLKTMKSAGIMPTAIAYNAAISACEKGLNPSKALEIFDEMKREGVRPTVVTFSALISACEKGQQWKLALSVLEEMKTTFGPNVIAYSAAISALSKGQQWEKAWELFCEIERSGEKLSVVTYNATMTALEKGLQWQRALDLFDEMKYKNMPVTVVSYGSAISACEKGYQWRQCLEYLDEMTERKIPKNVIIFGAAMSCMEKSCRADIAFQLMDRMNLEGVRPNVHIYNSAISACARCKLWKKGFELFKEMDDVGIKRDVVTYNAVLDAVCSQVDLAKQIFHEGVERGFYAKVSRLGTQWLELDLHFLSLGGGETALRWWFEECLVPYLGDSKELASVKSIDIVTGYGKTRARGARKGDDGMRKRVRAMLSFMNVHEIEQPNLGRIHIDKDALMKEVERNGGRIIFDARGYEQYKMNEGLDEPYSDAPQYVRPRGGAMHGRDYHSPEGEQHIDSSGNGNLAHDRQGPGGARFRSDEENYYDGQNNNHYGNEDTGRRDRPNNSVPRGISQSANYDNNYRIDGRGGAGDDFQNTRQSYTKDSAPQVFQLRTDNYHLQDRNYPTQSYNEDVMNQHQDQWQERNSNSGRYDSEPSRYAPAQQGNNSDMDYQGQSNRDGSSWRDNNGNDNLNYKSSGSSFGRNIGDGTFDDGRQRFHSPRSGLQENRKRQFDNFSDDRNYGNRGRQQGSFNSYQDETHYGSNNNYGGRRDNGENPYPNKRQYR